MQESIQYDGAVVRVIHDVFTMRRRRLQYDAIKKETIRESGILEGQMTINNECGELMIR